MQIDPDILKDFHDYTRIWADQLDRGGLVHVTDTFYNLLVALENICRKYLNIRITPREDVFHKIIGLHSVHVGKVWDELVQLMIPPEKSKELLDFAVKLWTNIRVHSLQRSGLTYSPIGNYMAL